MKEAGIVRIRTSILRRQNTVVQFIATRPILDLCEKAVRRSGAQVPRRWWEQTRIYWKGARENAESAAEAAEPGAKALTETESKADSDTTDGTVRGTGGRRPWAQADPVERGGGLTPLTPLGRDLRQVQNVVNFKLKRDRV